MVIGTGVAVGAEVDVGIGPPGVGVETIGGVFVGSGGEVGPDVGIAGQFSPGSRPTSAILGLEIQ